MKAKAFRINKLALMPALLIIGVLIIYRPVIRYCFIGDDWVYLNIFTGINGWGGIKSLFLTCDHIASYRPLAHLFALMLYNLFGSKHIVFNISVLLIHCINSLLVVFIVKKIINKDMIAWATGFLYAFAVNILIYTMVWSLTGHQETLGALFLYAGIALFLNKKFTLSAAAYLLAVLSKPSAFILFFIILVLFILDDENKKRFWVNVFKKLPLHFIIGVVYLIFSVNNVFISHPPPQMIKLSLWGPHLFDKFLWYISLIPRAILPSGSAQVIFVVYALLAMLFFVALRQKGKQRSGENDRGNYQAAFWAAWFLLGLIPPCIIAEDKVNAYYLTYSLCPLIVLFLIFVRYVVRLFFDERAFRWIAAGLVLISFISGSLYLRARDREGVESKEMMIRGAYIVEDFKEKLIQRYPALPQGAVIILPDEALYWYLGGPVSALRIWYHDPTLMVSRVENPAEIISPLNDKISILVPEEDLIRYRNLFPGEQVYAVITDGQKLILIKVNPKRIVAKINYY
ncbi:MAG: hypothetical protein KKB82_09515 [Candidatus Omnitrophica bacterium]|nr:hypothetical protein [Candidatus Omnitrophota bacterium]